MSPSLINITYTVSQLSSSCRSSDPSAAAPSPEKVGLRQLDKGLCQISDDEVPGASNWRGPRGLLTEYSYIHGSEKM